jgi:hypothetical protein
MRSECSPVYRVSQADREVYPNLVPDIAPRA